MSSKEKKVTKKDLQEQLKALGAKRISGLNKTQLQESLASSSYAVKSKIVKVDDTAIKKSYESMNKKEPVTKKRDIPKIEVNTNRLVALANTQFLSNAYKTLGKTEPKWKKKTEDTELFLQNAELMLKQHVDNDNDSFFENAQIILQKQIADAL
jgi:hypothetical protein